MNSIFHFKNNIIMKRMVLLLITFLFINLGCSVIDELTHFNMEYNQSVVIPSTVGVELPFSVSTPAVESNSESTFAINDTRKDMIEEIVLKGLTLTLTEPADGDFSFLESISIYISAEGLEEIEIAWVDQIPSGYEQSIQLETSNADLQEYIKKDNFNLRLNTVTDEIITSDHHIDIHSVFFVDARILGI